MKQVYEKPLSELFEIQPEGSLLSGSVEKMQSVAGSWDNEEDW